MKPKVKKTPIELEQAKAQRKRLKKSGRIYIRVSAEQRDLLKRGAVENYSSITDFILSKTLDIKLYFNKY